MFHLVVISGTFLLVLATEIPGYFRDKKVIEDKAVERGWKDVRVSRTFFAPGWFTAYLARDYRVIYDDVDGQRKEVYCRRTIYGGYQWFSV